LSLQNTFQREIKGLVKACEYADAAMGILITLEDDEELIFRGKKIKIIPAWKWCAEEFDLYEMS